MTHTDFALASLETLRAPRLVKDLPDGLRAVDGGNLDSEFAAGQFQLDDAYASGCRGFLSH